MIVLTRARGKLEAAEAGEDILIELKRLSKSSSETNKPKLIEKCYCAWRFLLFTSMAEEKFCRKA
jgi:hypothetical protein